MIDDRSNTRRAWEDVRHGKGIDRFLGLAWFLALAGYAAIAIAFVWIVVP